MLLSYWESYFIKSPYNFIQICFKLQSNGPKIVLLIARFLKYLTGYRLLTDNIACDPLWDAPGGVCFAFLEPMCVQSSMSNKDQ